MASSTTPTYLHRGQRRAIAETLYRPISKCIEVYCGVPLNLRRGISARDNGCRWFTIKEGDELRAAMFAESDNPPTTWDSFWKQDL